MKFSRSLLLTFVAAAAVVSTSCSDHGSPTAPAAPQQISADLIGDLTYGVQGLLLQCTPMPAYHASQVIGPDGGTLVIGPHTFTVPRGALTSPVLITADAPHDNLNRVIFQPEGLTFRTPAALTMSYANCQGLGSLLPKHIAYTNDLLQILSFINSIDNIFANKVTGQVNHFSEYILAW
jgi:hypothetical protein